MTVVYVIVAALVFLFLGIGIAILGAFGWYMLKMIKELKTAVDSQVRATAELLGEGSFSRISKGLTSLTSNMPEILAGLKEFSRVMRIFAKTAMDPDKVAEMESEENQSAVYGYSEATAASNEITEAAKKDKLVLTEEQLKHMRTDSDTPPAA
jgi:hypothetical protein